jgi:hypothetical protein
LPQVCCALNARWDSQWWVDHLRSWRQHSSLYIMCDSCPWAIKYLGCLSEILKSSWLEHLSCWVSQWSWMFGLHVGVDVLTRVMIIIESLLDQRNSDRCLYTMQVISRCLIDVTIAPASWRSTDWTDACQSWEYLGSDVVGATLKGRMLYCWTMGAYRSLVKGRECGFYAVSLLIQMYKMYDYAVDSDLVSSDRSSEFHLSTIVEMVGLCSISYIQHSLTKSHAVDSSAIFEYERSGVFLSSTTILFISSHFCAIKGGLPSVKILEQTYQKTTILSI